ncbi:hypothetical protein EDB80DRAFT_713609 [Ilyonectria destructans]|nr:hypothetical protein EDB80DRAFT_713609 [Ilyonectria destructans]
MIMERHSIRRRQRRSTPGDSYLHHPYCSSSESGNSLLADNDVLISTWGAEGSTRDSIPCVNELAARRDADERTGMVQDWLLNDFNEFWMRPNDATPSTILDFDQHLDLSNDEVAFGNQTANIPLAGQLYFQGNKSTLKPEDYDLIASNRNWGNAPILFSIFEDTLVAPGVYQPERRRYQPESSQAAIQRFETMIRDTDSIVSRAASWGTRRASLLSIPDLETEEGSVVGNMIRMFKVRGGEKRTGLLKDLRGLVRRPPFTESQLVKRNRADGEEGEGTDNMKGKRFLQPKPPMARSSRGKRPVPSIRTALMSMRHGLASIGTRHSEAGSTNATTIPSPKSEVVQVKALTPATSPKSELGNIAGNNTVEGVPNDGWADRKPETNGPNDNSAGGTPDFSHPVFDESSNQKDCETTNGESEPRLDLQLEDLEEPIDTISFWGKPRSETSKGGDDKISNHSTLRFPHLKGLSPKGVEDNLSESVGFSIFEPGPTLFGEQPPSPELRTTSKYQPIAGEGSGSMLPPPATSGMSTPDLLADNPEALSPLQHEESKNRTPSEPQDECKTLMLESAKGHRQVGFARVKIELLSLPRSHRSSCRQSDYESSQCSEGEAETEASLHEDEADADPVDGNGDNLTAQCQPSGGSRELSSSSGGSSTNTSGGPVDGDSVDSNNNPNTRSDGKAPKPTKRKDVNRFACPYQAFETSQNCFQPGPRNPNGGCAGIQRLKQHLTRRHMRSFRCSKCWRSFETRDKVNGHIKQQEPCEAREMSPNERFMLSEHEASLEKLGSSACPEETWWKLFQLLVPDIQSWTLESLKSRYWPYYVSFDAFRIPSMVFPHAYFESEQPSLHIPGTTMEGSEYVTPNTQCPSLNVDPGCVSNTTPVSHTVYMPLLEASTGFILESGLQSLHHSESGALTLTPDFDPQTLTVANSVIPSSETAIQTSQNELDQTQTRRNYDRLRARHSRLEEEVTDFHETIRNARSNIGRADAVIDDLLALENLPRHIEDRLSEVSQILERVQKGLR